MSLVIITLESPEEAIGFAGGVEFTAMLYALEDAGLTLEDLR